MSNVTKFLLLAFSLGITCMLIVYFKRTADVGFDIAEAATRKLEKYNIELSESEMTMYDGTEVKGSDVVNFIKKNIGSYSMAETAPLYVYVRTVETEATYTNGGSLKDIQDFSSTRYIKPVATFTCYVTRDANDVIVGLSFLQK